MALQGMPGQPQRYRNRTDRRGCAQQAQRLRAGVQDVLDERRQHGDSTTQQHRKHVQGHRAQHDLVAGHEACPLGNAGKNGAGLLQFGRLGDRHRQQGGGCHQCKTCPHCIRHGFSKEAHQHATQGWPQYQSRLKDHAAQTGASGKLVASQDAREQSVIDRAEHRTADTAHGHRQIDGPSALGVQGNVAGHQGQHAGIDGQQGAGGGAHLAARQVIYQMPGERGHAKIRDDFGQAHQAQRQGVVGHLVDMPAHRHRHDLVRQQGAYAIQQQPAEPDAAQRRWQ